MVWDDAAKKNTRELITVVLAFLAGSVVLAPSLNYFYSPPYVFRLGILLFLVFSVVSFVSLCFALYFTFTKATTAPHKSHGIGNIFALLAFVFITIYLAANLLTDTNTAPNIEDINYSPLNPKKGSMMRIKAIVNDIEKDDINYSWQISGELISSDSFAYYHIPNDSNSVEITFTATDSQGNVSSRTVHVHFQK